LHKCGQSYWAKESATYPSPGQGQCFIKKKFRTGTGSDSSSACQSKENSWANFDGGVVTVGGENISVTATKLGKMLNQHIQLRHSSRNHEEKGIGVKVSTLVASQ
jgi:hypothetical protein